MIGQDGKMVFVRHGGVYVRVSPNRLVKCSRTEQSSENDADEPGGATFTKGSGDTEISAGDAEGLNSSEDESQSADKGSVAVVPVVPAEEADGQSPVDCATEGVSVGVQLEKCAAPSSGTDLKIPKKGDNIRYRMKGDSSWNEASVIGRAGKVSGKYSSWVNLFGNEGELCIDFNDVDVWDSLAVVEHANLVAVRGRSCRNVKPLMRSCTGD